MSSHWFCHQCRAMTRPLMTPNPICDSCRGSFVESLEDPADDPRDFNQDRESALDDVVISIQSPEDLVPAFRRLHSRAGPSATSGLRFESHSTTRDVNAFGGSDTHGPSPPRLEYPATTMLEFLRREADNPLPGRGDGEINAPFVLRYISTFFGSDPPAHADPVTELLVGSPSTGRWGDYVFNQEALDHILTQIAENSTAGRPVPATEEIVGNLPREVLSEGSSLLERDCAVCKESFRLHPEDLDELIVVTLPCKHPFHETCILPWLKSSGTCPVCRFALTAQPQQHPPGGPSQAGGSSSSGRTNLSPEPRPQSSGNSDRGGASNFFHALFGGRSSSNTGNRDTLSARSRRRANRNTRPEAISNTPPFPGEWIEDID